MALLGNTLLFLDTGFFKKYKEKDQAYEQLFKYSAGGSIILCTSDLCFEEWRTQKIQDLENNLESLDRKINDHVSSHCGENFFSKILLSEKTYLELRSPKILKDKSRKIIDDFSQQHQIRRYSPKEKHIDPTWDSYFHGHPPFKKRKNKEDIPDAWIYEGAKDALAEPEHQSLGNKFCLTGDDTMRDALIGLGFSSITLSELVEAVKKEEVGITPQVNYITPQQLAATIDSTTTQPDDSTPLDSLLSKAISDTAREIYLRLLGFVIPLDTPTHDSLINAVVARGFDRRLTEACAVILSDKSNPFIKDTGNHYIAGSKEICTAAADRLTQEIIDMLDQG